MDFLEITSYYYDNSLPYCDNKYYIVSANISAQYGIYTLQYFDNIMQYRSGTKLKL